jgi:alanyl-tRNA synthetase
MGEAFSELVERRDTLERTIRAEEEGFLRTLATGIEMFSEVASALKDVKEQTPHTEGGSVTINTRVLDLVAMGAGEAEPDTLAFIRAAQNDIVPGEIAFLLHDTYGFPGDLTALMAREEGLAVDEARFSELMEEQRQRARAAGTFAVDQSDVAAWHTVSEGEHSAFEGYAALEVEDARIRRWRTLGAGENARHEVVLDRTPFYAESGGQIGDTGVLEVGGEELSVLDTQKLDDGTIAHTVDRLPADPSAPVTARVTGERRRRIVQHHTATHLLHAALRQVLGAHVQQKGSLVAPDRLRFDFAHFERVTPEEQREIERRVNRWVLQNIPADIQTGVPLAEAKARGAMALFGEKYGETVRVVTFGPEVSVELCGGTHAGATGEVGLFRIVSEGSVASGVRRIEAVAGEAALEYVEAELAALEAVRSHFRALQKPVEEAVADVLEERRQLEKEVAALKQQTAAADLGRLLESAIQIQGPNGTPVRLVTGDLGAADMDTLRDVATDFREKLGASGVAVLGARDPEGGKVYLAAAVSDDLTKRVQAGKLVGVLAKMVGGGGGGRPQLATAGGRNPEALPEALAAAEAEVRAALAG